MDRLGALSVGGGVLRVPAAAEAEEDGADEEERRGSVMVRPVEGGVVYLAEDDGWHRLLAVGGSVGALVVGKWSLTNG